MPPPPVQPASPPARRLLPPRWLRRALAAILVLAGGVDGPRSPRAPAAEIESGFEEPQTSWVVAESDVPHRVLDHDRSRLTPHGGAACERIVLDAEAGTSLRLQTPIGPAAVIDEWHASLWVRANRPDIRLSARVVLPAFIAPATGRPVEVLVPGRVSKQVDHWELLEVGDIAAGLQRLLPALHAQHGPSGGIAGAVATHLVLELYTAPGRYEVAVDDMLVRGVVAAGGSIDAGRPGVRDAAVRPATGWREQPRPTDGGPPGAEPAGGLNRGVLEVAGLPFFPRSLDYNGEPLETIASLGFNCVRLSEPAPGDLLADARRAGLWVICPPPSLPDVDVRDPESMPVFSANWDRVLLWDLGSGLAESDVGQLAERARRVRACDQRSGRPLIAAADSGLRPLSRHIDLLVARRTVLGTSLELLDYLTWLRERPRLTRPGTPLLATLSTEVDPRAAWQAATLAGIGGRGLAVDPESLSLAALTAVAAGTRGLLFGSSRRIDGDDHESRARAVAAQAMNIRLKVLEPWGAAGRFAAAAQTSDPEVQAVVLEASRARMVVVWRCVQGAQVVPRHYHGDVPQETASLSLLVPGVPEAHQAWEVAPGGLRPLKQKRVTGGVSVVLDSFRSSALVLISGEPAVTAHVQERVRELAPVALASARAQAAIALADGATLLARLPPAALGNLPAARMLGEAQRDALDAETLAATEPAAAIARLGRAAAIAGQLERLAWERGVLATGSMVASPLCASDAALAEHWRFIEALVGVAPGPELLTGGGMERIEDLAGGGWRHFAMRQAEIRTVVEVSRSQPAAGSGSLRMLAEPATAEEAPAVLETPPVWVTTPPIQAPTGKLLEIQARVWVPAPIRGTVDGLLVFDSLGGPALAERVGPTPGWRRLVLYRIVPMDAPEEPLVLTFALTGLGEARIDDVSIRVLERGTPNSPPPAVVAAPSGDARGFARPGELLAPLPAAPPSADRGSATAATAPQWPGMNLEWPRLLPFGQPSNAPPPGPGGGRIDPFKRARPAAAPNAG